MRRLLLLLFLSIFPITVCAQATTGYHRVGQVLARSSGGVTAKIVPGASVSVTNTSTGLTATIYRDPQMLSQITPAVVTSDTEGSYGYYFALNTCVTETVSAPGQGIKVTPNICSNSAVGSYPASGVAVSAVSGWAASLAAPTGAILGTTDVQATTNKTVNGLDPAHFGYLLNLSSDAQAQINSKAAAATTVNLHSLSGNVVVSANDLPYGSTTYTTSTIASTADNGVIVKMNCSAPCTYTLPALQPSPTWHTSVVSVGSSTATVLLGGADTFNGTVTPPVLPVQVWANSNLSTGYLGISTIGGTAPTDLGTLTYNASGTTTFAAASAANAAAIVTTTHSTSTALSPTGLVKWGTYVLEIKQDGTGGGVTFTLGTAGSCSAWKVGGGGAGAITLSSTASTIDVLSFTYDGTNCLANFRNTFN